ncbi:hypothetical protein OM076_23600 [Solirubrobacter ginsenosidimutans]|uniref:Uncharacterized protein n=1 Tax=Solirubrobacter ginsenosidimutans TaxID=490573 RepID=A0A9X3MXR8_9ACTN|nr:hypothetical protein [Solirubrobacter ginsenosidimutans]MDA0163280.1 hypothetical protein [Solirubrobacter ginsenosidimutans]
MTDRPIAAILAAVAAAVFLAAFSAAAVLRPDTAAVADDTTNASPAAATQELKPATIAAPSLSRVAALPALHLPVHRKPAKRKHKVAKSSPKVSVAPRFTPVPTATPSYTPPARTYTPPQRKSSSSKTFDTSG